MVASGLLSQHVLPYVPFGMFWTSSKSWIVSTGLSERELFDTFEDVLGRGREWAEIGDPSVYRVIAWEFDRTSVTGECRATAQVLRQRTRVFGECIVLRVNQTNGQSNAELTVPDKAISGGNASVMTYGHAVVKGIKRADNATVITYPWSYFAVAAASLGVIIFLVFLAMLAFVV